MSQGLFTAVSGVRANQQALNVISSNVANVNTIAFKGAKANFATVFFDTISSGSAPTGGLGGTNPKQVGNGTYLSDIAVNHNQGGTQFTGRNTDLLIQGEGYFVLEQNQDTATGDGIEFTRAGNFSLDSDGNLVSFNGNRVVGTSNISGSSPTTDGRVNIPLNFQITKFFDANANVIDTAFGSTAAAAADYTAYATANSITAASTTTEEVSLVNFSIGNNGAISATYSNGDRISARPNPDGTVGRTELVHYPAEGGTYAAINNTGDDGSTGQLGGALAVFTNSNATADPMEGMQLQLKMATVGNPQGLVAKGNNKWQPSENSGDMFFGIPSSGNRGQIQSGSLESSNVDLAMEFTNLVIHQRGLEASSRLIRAQSEVMQNIINAV